MPTQSHPSWNDYMSAPTGPVARFLKGSELYTHYSGELTSRLSLAVVKGREEASAHRPPSDAAQMDLNEVEIQSEAEKAIGNEEKMFALALTETSRVAYELRQKIGALEGRIQQLLADTSLHNEAAAELAADRASLVAATERRMRAEVDLRSFRAKHGITQQAKYPESRVYHLAIILVFALIETVINAFFYENAQGLLGGFVVALSVSAVNMIGAVSLGFMSRYRHLRDEPTRYLGWLAIVLFVVLSLYCNALFAAFRAQYQLLADPTDAAQVSQAFRLAAEQAARAFLLSMKFMDLMSFILFCIGLLLSYLAFSKGATLDDRYPEHGEKDRLVKTAKDSELSARQFVREKLKTFLEQRRRTMQAIALEPQTLISAAGDRAAHLQHAYQLCQSHQDSIQTDYSLLLRTYRDANAAIRATAAPHYFAHIPDIRRPVSQNAMEEVLTLLSDSHQRATALRQKYQEQLNTKINDTQRDAASLLDREFNNFLRSVEREAEDEINRMTPTVQRAGVAMQPSDAY